MKEPGDETITRSDGAIEALLERATPRQAPPPEIEHDVRQAVHADWQAVAGTRRRRRQFGGFAVAATVVLAVTVAFNTLNTGVAPIEVATIDKQHGSIVLESERSGQAPAADFTSVQTGQTLLTASDSAVGLHWNSGGSLRIDENTRVEFVSASEIYLHSGRVYFDSASELPDASFTILTSHGNVSHVGTQYMTEAQPSSLKVLVREGEVSVSGTFHDGTAAHGQIIELVGSSRPTITNTTGTGSNWEWIEIVAPTVDMSGRSIYDFLMWVGRETGHDVRFTTDAALQLAKDNDFVGEISADPRNELQLRMLTIDLDAQIDPQGPAIVVSESK